MADERLQALRRQLAKGHREFWEPYLRARVRQGLRDPRYNPQPGDGGVRGRFRFTVIARTGKNDKMVVVAKFWKAQHGGNVTISLQEWIHWFAGPTAGLITKIGDDDLS
jgi:hypothetical protein